MKKHIAVEMSDLPESLDRGMIATCFGYVVRTESVVECLQQTIGADDCGLPEKRRELDHDIEKLQAIASWMTGNGVDIIFTDLETEE